MRKGKSKKANDEEVNGQGGKGGEGGALAPRGAAAAPLFSRLPCIAWFKDFAAFKITMKFL